MPEGTWLTPTLITSFVGAVGALTGAAMSWMNWRDQRRRPTPDVLCTVYPTPLADWWKLSLSIANRTDRSWEIESFTLDRPATLTAADETGTKKVAKTGYTVGKYEYLDDAERRRFFPIGVRLYPTTEASAREGVVEVHFFLWNPDERHKAFSATLRMSTLEPRQRRRSVRIRRRLGPRHSAPQLRSLSAEPVQPEADS